MTLVDWWIHAPEAISPKVPTLLKALLLPWAGIGTLMALIPDLQQMPPIARATLMLPFALGMLWMGIGVLLSMIDKIVAISAFVRRRIAGSR